MTKSYESTSTHLFMMTDYEHLKIAEIIDGVASEELVKLANKGALLDQHFEELNTLIRRILLSLKPGSQTDTLVDKAGRLGQIMRLLEGVPSLKPCPFCGGEAKRGTDKTANYLHTVICDDCNVETIGHTNDEKAANTWNKRV